MFLKRSTGKVWCEVMALNSTLFSGFHILKLSVVNGTIDFKSRYIRIFFDSAMKGHRSFIPFVKWHPHFINLHNLFYVDKFSEYSESSASRDCSIMFHLRQLFRQRTWNKRCTRNFKIFQEFQNLCSPSFHHRYIQPPYLYLYFILPHMRTHRLYHSDFVGGVLYIR